MDIYIADWFPRTKAHISELYDFFENGVSHLALDAQDLKSFHGALGIKKVERGFERLEYIEVETKNDIFFRIYVDGLIIFHKKAFGNLKEEIYLIDEYYDEKFLPAYLYLFSIGAPLSRHTGGKNFSRPNFIVGADLTKDILAEFSFKEKNKKPILSAKVFDVFQDDNNFIVITSKKDKLFRQYVEEQAFLYIIREQLHSYIDLHREIWSTIDGIREQKEVAGKDIDSFAPKIARYLKMTYIIAGRLRQIQIYIDTRTFLIDGEEFSADFKDTLTLSYRTLSDMLSYTKELWFTTEKHVEQVMTLFSQIESKISKVSIANLSIIAIVGAGAVIINLFTNNKIPEFTTFGLTYALVLILLVLVANTGLKSFYKYKKYSVEEIKDS